ncbi:MAG: triple tyrosine motif-containing protein [Balneolales bacterium]
MHEDGSYIITGIRKEHGLYDNVIHKIIDDGMGRFWMSTNQGIFYVNKADLEAFHRGEITRFVSISYTEEHGMANREANGGVQQAGMRASNDEIWFPTQDGAAIVNPGNIKINMVMPPVVIENVWVGERLVPVTAPQFTLAAAERNFQVDFTALSFFVPKRVQFRYMLENFDREWINPGERRSAIYTNVPAGKYTFRVIAANNDGVWNEAGASLVMVIEPLFTETRTFYLLLGALLILLFTGGIRARTWQLTRQEMKLRELVDKRTGELRREKQVTESLAEQLQETGSNRAFLPISVTNSARPSRLLSAH